MAMAIAGVAAVRRGAATPGRAATIQSGDGVPSDHPGADGGWDGPAIRADGPGPCFVPTDCTAGLACCVVLEGGGGRVICPEKALCPGDGV